MLIADPLGEGSNASSTNNELWLRRERHFRKNTEHLMCELTTGWILEKCPKSSVCTYHNMDFRKNAEHFMCDLTTEWILESAQSLTCYFALIYIYIFWPKGAACS